MLRTKQQTLLRNFQFNGIQLTAKTYRLFERSAPEWTSIPSTISSWPYFSSFAIANAVVVGFVFRQNDKKSTTNTCKHTQSLTYTFTLRTEGKERFQRWHRLAVVVTTNQQWKKNNKKNNNNDHTTSNPTTTTLMLTRSS